MMLTQHIHSELSSNLNFNINKKQQLRLLLFCLKEKIMVNKRYLSKAIVLIFIIVAQLCWTTYNFVFQKQGCHSDEIWSYGLANSYYQPFIYLRDGVFIDNGTSADVINCNEWVSGETFHNYITVQKGERFSYASVYHNQSLDHHPPLYYALLHTICSFFPETFSFWFAYSLNCIFLVFTQIFLYKLIKILAASETAALLGCFLYGAGTGALSTFIFLRQYSLLTMLGVMFTYFNARLFQTEDYKKNLPPVIITSFMCFMTHYTGIAYVGIFTACFCIYLLLKKKFKKMFLHGFSVLGALLLYFIIYPAGLKQIIGSNFGGNTILPYTAQVKSFFSYITKYNLGFHISIFKSAVPNIILAVLFSVIILLIPVAFLFRKEFWFLHLEEKIKKVPTWAVKKIKTADYTVLFIIISVSGLVMILANTVDIKKMGVFSMRYIFMTFPLACATVTVIIYRLLNLINIKKVCNIICLIAVVLVTAKVNITAPCRFFFQHYGDVQDVNQLLTGKNCVIINYERMKNSTSAWLLQGFVYYVEKADNVFYTSGLLLEDMLKNINSIDTQVDYVIIDSSQLILNEEEIETVANWNNINTQSEEQLSIVIGSENQLEEFDHRINCSDLIKQINGGCNYEIMFGLNIQGGLYYVLRLI